MLRPLQDLIASLFEPTSAAAPTRRLPDAHALQLATAVLLVEVMRAEGGIGEDERRAGLRVLQQRFELSDDERESLLAHAERAARDAIDLYRFTSTLNAHLDEAAKIRMVESLWAVAFADGELAAHERHIIWRVSDLLHVKPGDYAAAKSRAQAAAGAPR